MNMFTLTEDEKAQAMELLAAHPEFKVVMWKRDVKHSMLFNHIFHSPRWFWTHGMKKRAVAQYGITLGTIIAAYALVAYMAKREEEQLYMVEQ